MGLPGQRRPHARTLNVLTYQTTPTNGWAVGVANGRYCAGVSIESSLQVWLFVLQTFKPLYIDYERNRAPVSRVTRQEGRSAAVLVLFCQAE